MTSWATADDVQTLTGKTVDDATVDMAAGIIEMTTAGRAISMPDIQLSDRNRDWIRRAVAYQAAFMIEYPDFFSRQDVSSFTQDGASATFKPDGLVLSPLARRCIKRLSWRGVRTIFPGGTSSAVILARYTSDDFDDALPYRPL